MLNDQVRDQYIDRFEGGDRTFFRDTARAIIRCRRDGCLLLVVWDSPEGTLWMRPAYKLSRGLSLDSSTEAGRDRNTLDGDRHWKANVDLFGNVRVFDPRGGISLECRHVHHYAGRDQLVAAVDSSTPGMPTKVAL